MKEKIKELSNYVDKNMYILQKLHVVNTKVNLYIIQVEHIGNGELKYRVLKKKTTGEEIGYIDIKRVDEFIIVYDDTVSKLPDRVSKYIRLFYNYYNRYRNIGDLAFKRY